jgi:uncharacterized protein (TIGR02145 family)
VTWVTAPSDGPGGFVGAPTGSTAATANAGPGFQIAGYETANGYSAPNSSWNRYAKTINDPCPSGWRVPLAAEWTGVMNNNTLTRTGTFVSSYTNYNSGLYIGPNASTKSLTLPFTGQVSTWGNVTNRGVGGLYWSSEEDTYSPTLNAYELQVGDPAGGYTNLVYSTTRTNGSSIRCIQE